MAGHGTGNTGGRSWGGAAGKDGPARRACFHRLTGRSTDLPPSGPTPWSGVRGPDAYVPGGLVPPAAARCGRQAGGCSRCL